MANTASAKKRARQAEVRRQRNVSLRSRVRTFVKKVTKAAESGDQQATATSLREAVPVIDSMVNKGMIHRNKAARHKSRLNAKLRALSAAA